MTPAERMAHKRAIAAAMARGIVAPRPRRAIAADPAPGGAVAIPVDTLPPASGEPTGAPLPRKPARDSRGRFVHV